jgi:uncharacterized membrane protein YfcA
MSVLGALFGAIVGFSLGLTGGGGSLFAVPLLVYGLGVPADAAVGISLAAVGAIAFAGFLQRWRRGKVEVKTGLFFGVGGIAGAPVGQWLSGWISETLLLTGFAVLMLVVAVRMWRQSATHPGAAEAIHDRPAEALEDEGPSCRRDASGVLRLSSRCTAVLVFAGVGTGVLSGLFGVGGGFIIVPALLFFTGMSVHRAVATSLMAISLIGASGVAAYLVRSGALNVQLMLLFIVGGLAGLVAGTLTARRLSGPVLQRVFAGAIVLVAVYMLVKNIAEF